VLIRNATKFEKLIVDRCPKQFSHAQIPARRTIRRILAEKSIEARQFQGNHSHSRLNLQDQKPVTGALNQEDILRLQKLKVEISTNFKHVNEVRRKIALDRKL